MPSDPAHSSSSGPAIPRKAVNPIERFFPLVDGKRDRRIRHTPHYQLLEHYRNTGERLYEHDYTRLQVARARLKGQRLGDALLRGKVDSLCDVLDSIRDQGYLAGRFKRFPIMIFERSIRPPGPEYEPADYEILDGHHRAAAAAVLGITPIKVMVLRAVKMEEYDLSEEIPWDEASWPETALAASSKG